jgi:hypothetical protein
MKAVKVQIFENSKAAGCKAKSCFQLFPLSKNLQLLKNRFYWADKFIYI